MSVGTRDLLAGQVLLDVADGEVLERGFAGLGESSLLGDGLEEWLLGGSDVFEEFKLEVGDVLWGDLVEVTSDTAEDASNLLGNVHWGVLGLLEELGESDTSVEELLGGGIHIGTELSEGGDLSVLREIELHGTGDLLHGLELGGGSDSGDGETDVDCWSDTLVEELGLQEDLTVSDGDDVGWDVGGHITGLGLDHWKRGQGTGALVVGHLGSSLQKSRVQVEYITWVGLSSWWSSEEKGHLSVGNGLLGQIVVHDESVSSVISEPLAHGAARVWREVLKWGGVGGGGDNNDAVLQAIGLLEDVDQLGDGGLLLADGDVDAVELLGLLALLVESPLVQDGVESDGGLSGLSIANDQLSLASADWHQGVDGLETGLHWLVHGLSGDDTGGFDVDSSSLFGVDWAFAVDRVSERVDNSAEELWADWDVHDSASSSYDVALFDLSIVTEHDDTDVVWLQVQSHTLDAAIELNHLFGLDVLQTVHSSNTISDGQHLSGLLEINLAGLAGDSLLEEMSELGGSLLVLGDLRGGEGSGGNPAAGLEHLLQHFRISLSGFCKFDLRL